MPNVSCGVGFGSRYKNWADVSRKGGEWCRCKHITAIEHVLLISAEAAAGKRIKIWKMKLKCSGCEGTEFTCDGRYHGQAREWTGVQVLHMQTAVLGLGFEYRQVPKTLITLALMLSGMGRAPANIRTVFKQQEIGVHGDTITKILVYNSKMVDKKIKVVKPPCIGGKWGYGEKHQKIRGIYHWIVSVMDPATGFVLAWDISDTKGYDAVPLLRAAKDMATKIPRIFITDILEQYHIAFKKVFRTIQGIRSIHIRNLLCNTNLQERLNGWFVSSCCFHSVSCAPPGFCACRSLPYFSSRRTISRRSAATSCACRASEASASRLP